ncbi:MAG: IS21 family transposase [Cyclobacteriaceae bacterium]
MSTVKQLLKLHQQGKGRKTIAKTLGMSKNTVKSYLAKLGSLKEGKDALDINDLLKLEDPILEAKFHPGNPAYKPDKRYGLLKDKLDYLVEELKRPGVTKQLLWQEYSDQHPGKAYSYSQFCFHLQQQLKASKPTLVLTHHPGEKLFIDFAGKPMYYCDPESGEQIKCQVFVASLPYSDYCFAMAVRSQSTEDFLYALSCCLSHLGGVPQALVPDNLKAAVVKADRYEPGINQVMEDFANHYQTTVVPARVKKPQDKALVENAVKLVYNRVYAKLRNTTFMSLQELNEAIAEKVKDHNQTRMQQKNWCREEKFLAEEKQTLAALPQNRFQIKYYRELTAAKNNHIYLSVDKHYYSIPHTLIGKKVKVIYTRSMVYIYQAGKQVAVHVRSNGIGTYTTIEGHLCSQHRQYRDRSPDYYMKNAKSRSKTFHRLVGLIFDQNRYPEQLYKTCDGLLRLAAAADISTFDKACQMAIDHHNYSYIFIKNILENKMTEVVEPDSQGATSHQLPTHQNLRGSDYYQQMEIEYTSNNQIEK